MIIYRILLISMIAVMTASCVPFAGLKNCTDTSGNGIACGSLEDNLNYSIEKDNIKEVKISDNETISSDIAVEKSELERLMAELSIDPDVSKKPIMIPPATYKVLIMPYSSGAKYYAGRYIYISAGKPRWVTGNQISTKTTQYNIDIPELSSRLPQKLKAENADIKSLVFKHRVNAYLLNCRDMPSIEGNSVAVFDQNRILDIVDKSQDWWQVNYYDVNCFVNSKYLYSEPEL